MEALFSLICNYVLLYTGCPKVQFPYHCEDVFRIQSITYVALSAERFVFIFPQTANVSIGWLATDR